VPDIKTRTTVRDIRVFDRAADAGRHMKDAFIKSKAAVESADRQAEQTQDAGYSSPAEYASDHISSGARTTAEQAAHTFRNPRQKAATSADKAKQHFENAKQQLPQARKQVAEQAKQTAQRTQQTAKGLKGKADQARQTVDKAQKSVREAKQTLIRTKETVKKTIKTSGRAQKGIKHSAKTVKATGKSSIKTAKRAVKTAQKTAKTATKTAKQAAKAAKRAEQAARAAAKAAAKAAKVAAKVLVATVKAIIAAIKGLVAAIAAGGWVAVVIILIICIVSAILGSVFGIFYSNETGTDDSQPMTEAVVSINDEFNSAIQSKVAGLKASHGADEVELIYDGDMDEDGSVGNWADVLAVYAVNTATGDDEQAEVLTVTPKKVEQLRSIFNDMNSVSYRTETETREEPQTDANGKSVLDEDGNPVMATIVTLYVYIDVSSQDYRDGAALYAFDDTQRNLLDELMQPEYYPLFAALTGDIIGDGGLYGFGLDINPNLPPNELGALIVQAAKKYIGRSYSSMDCSALVRAALKDCGLTSMNGLSSTGMAKRCQELGIFFTDASKLQAGDLIFFVRKDAKRGPGYCTDTRRCGTGKCKRWNQVHHVAIYINEEFLIDSTGGKNSVQIRKHWGKNGSEWSWLGFGRVVN